MSRSRCRCVCPILRNSCPADMAEAGRVRARRAGVVEKPSPNRGAGWERPHQPGHSTVKRRRSHPEMLTNPAAPTPRAPPPRAPPPSHHRASLAPHDRSCQRPFRPQVGAAPAVRATRGRHPPGTWSPSPASMLALLTSQRRGVPSIKLRGLAGDFAHAVDHRRE